MGDKFKISDLQSAKLQQEATNIDKYLGNNDGAIDKRRETKKLQALLNGDAALKAELANENDDIKKMFGYTGSVQAQQTQAAAQQAAAQQEVKETVKADEAEEKQEDKATSAKQKGEEVKDAYYRYRGVDPYTREKLLDEAGNPVKGLSPKEAYEAVEEAYKDNKEYKHAVKDLKKYSIDAEAKLVVVDAISRAESKKSKDVKKDAEEILKAEGNWDKHTKKALNGNGHNWWVNALDWASGKSSDMKLVRKAQAAGNKAKDKADDVITKEDFTKAIGKRSPLFKEDDQYNMVIQKLVNPDNRKEQLVKKVDGGYDISALSAFISSQIGSDNTLSRQENKADAELEAIRSEFRKQGVNLSKEDTKQLVKFCGYRVERKNYAKTVYDTTLGGGIAALGTAGALATQARDVVRGTVSNHNYLELNLITDQSSIATMLNDPNMKKLIDDGAAQITEVTGGVQVILDQNYAQEYFHVASRHIGMNVLKSAAIGALVALAASLLEYGPSEKDVFSTRFKNGPADCEEEYVPKTYEEFVRYVDSRKELKDDQKLALKQIAVFFIEEENGKPATTELEVAKTDEKGLAVLDENGKPVIEKVTEMKWDTKGFQNYMNGQAGYTSNLNNVELLRAVQNAPDCLKTTVVTTDTDNTPKEKTYTGSERTIQGKVIKQKAPKTERFEDWGVFASRYKCIEQYDKNFKIYEGSKNANSYARTMMKVMQAITDDNYDLARLQSLTQKAMSANWRSELQNVPGFNFKTYEALRGNKKDNTFAMDRQNMPTITTVVDNSVVSDICAPTEKPLYTIGKQSGGKGSKIGLGDANNQRKGADSYEGGLRTSDGRNISADNHADYENKKQKLAEEGYIWQDPKKQ